MHKRWLLVLLAACGDNVPVEVGSDAAVPLVASCDESRVLETLQALPHVTEVRARSCGNAVVRPAQCFGITFEQPIQHAVPDGAKLPQQLFVIHRGCDRPTLVADWGYSNEYFFDDELSVLYRSNVIWAEHRYQGKSVPAIADWDWTALTIRNGAADMHEVVRAFRTYYAANFVSTGASKGGITATYHHYLYPQDLDGAIPYVAPASRMPIDPAYQQHLENNFPACMQQLRDAQVAALTTRRGMMLGRLTEVQPGYEVLMLEAMTKSFDWGFWQYYGVDYCGDVPTSTTTDTAFFDFFYDFSGFGGASPAANTEERSYGALWYEWLTEQGFALQIGAHVRPLVHEPRTLSTMADNFHDMFPEVALPEHDGSITHNVRKWARERAENLLLIYGQFDPWTGGAMDEPERATSARFFVPAATHGAQLMKLDSTARAKALAHATRMFGALPVMTMAPMAAFAGAQRADHLAGKMRQATARFTLRAD